VAEQKRQHTIQNLAFVPNVDKHIRDNMGQVPPEFAAKAVIQAVTDTRQAIWKAVFAEVAAATRLVETQPKEGVRELSSSERSHM
jgi:hypothetical protein